MTSGAGGSVIGEVPVAPAPTRSAAPTARPSLALVCTITVTGILHNTLMQAAIPDILDEFDASRGMSGIVVASGTVAGIVVAPLLGVLADRYGRAAVLVPCLVGFGVFGALQAVAPSLGVFLLLRFLQGVGGAGLINLAVTIIGDYWEGADRSRALGRNAAVLTVALAVFPAVGGWLTELGTWRLAVVPFALSLVTAALVWRSLPRTRPPRRHVSAQLRDAMGYMRRPAVLGAYGMGFVLFFLIFGLFLTVLPVHLEDDFGLGPGARGIILGVPAVSSTIAALAIGRLRTRWGLRSLLGVAWMMLSLAFVVIGVAPTLAALLAGTFVYGFGEGILIPTLQDVVTSAAPVDDRSSVVAVFVGVARFGQTTGPLSAGAFMAATSTAAPFFVGAGLSVAPLALLGWRRRGRATVPA